MSVERVAEIMQKGEPTPFALEGALRLHLRVEGIRAGESWEDADLAAAQLIQRALVSLNITRPTWKEAQALAVDDVYCAHCGEPIIVDEHYQLFCSHDCAIAFHNAKMVARVSAERATARAGLVCEGCGKSFTAPMRKRYCSHECLIKTRNDAALAKRAAARAGKTCQQCGQGFDATRANASFCSQKCGAVYRYRMKGDGPRHVRAMSAEAQGVLPGRLEEPIEDVVVSMPKRRKKKRRSAPVYAEAAE